MLPKHTKQTRTMHGKMASRSFGVDAPLVWAARLLSSGLLLACPAPAVARESDQGASSESPELVAAAAKYDEGVAAQARGDYASAAAAFTQADDMLPDPVALEAAVRAATLGDLATTAMQLTQRATRGSTTESLWRAVEEAKARFESRVGALTIECADCQAREGAVELPVNSERFLLVGQHVVELIVAGIGESHRVDILAGTVVVLRPLARVGAADVPSPPPSSPSQRSATGPDGASTRGWSPIWFVGGAALTAVAGGLTVWSGLDTLARHDDFLGEPTSERASDGQRAETRTYVLGGVTAGFGLATVALGLFAVDWGTGPVVELGLAPGVMGGSVRGTL